jgi:Flp pilus assembly protein CpaB
MLGVMLIGGIGMLGTLWATGHIELPFLARTTNQHEGKVQVLLSGSPIPAYTKVTRDHLINPKTQLAASFWLAKEQVPPGTLLDLGEIAGRVLKNDKAAGFAFTEDDFFPKGTRPGLTAGIPIGKRSMTLEADKIRGVAGLKAGDRFDIIASLTLDQKNRINTPRPLGAGANYVSNSTTAPKEARVRLVVDNGAVVQPIYVRAVPTTSHSLTSGAQTTTKPIQEVVLAVAPDEVPMLTEAIALGAELTAVARSGQPGDDQTTRISTEVQEAPKATVIETIQGRRREQVSVPLPPPTGQASMTVGSPSFGSVWRAITSGADAKSP